MTKLNSISKSRDISLPTKFRIVKAMVFPVVMYRCDILPIKKGWAPKNWSFWVVVLEKTLESPLDSKEIKPVNPKGNQPWIFIRRTDAEAEAPILWPLDAKNQLTGKTLMLWKIEDRRRRGWQRMRWLDGITDTMDMGLVDYGSWWWTGRPGVLQFMGSQRVGHDWATELTWTESQQNKRCRKRSTKTLKWNDHRGYICVLHLIKKYETYLELETIKITKQIWN